jgi:putative ABC transport system permease protein
MLIKSKGYTAVAVLALALGIGANTAIFSVADAFLLKPVALPNLENLVVLMERAPHQTADWTAASPANYLDWKRQSHSFAAFSPYTWDDANLTGIGQPERIIIARTAGNFFEVLGAKPLVGRVFLPEDERTGQTQTVVLSYGAWQRRYAADPSIVGRTVKLDGLSHQVIGVMDKKFNFPVSIEMWVPWTMDPRESQVRSRHYVQTVARLKPGVSLREASAEMTGISRRMAVAYPETNRGWDAQVVPIKYFVTGDLTYRYTLMLMAAVMFVLLSPAPTWPTSSSRAARRGSVSSPCARQWGPVAGAWCGSCSPKASRYRWWAQPRDWLSPNGAWS